MNKLDSQDQQILAERVKLRQQRPDPLIGDFVLFPDGQTERISCVWHGGLQTGNGSFHLTETGNGSFCGEPNRALGPEHFIATEETRPGRFWLSHNGAWMANNGIVVEAPCRIWRCDCLRG